MRSNNQTNEQKLQTGFLQSIGTFIRYLKPIHLVMLTLVVLPVIPVESQIIYENLNKDSLVGRNDKLTPDDIAQPDWLKLDAGLEKDILDFVEGSGGKHLVDPDSVKYVYGVQNENGTLVPTRPVTDPTETTGMKAHVIRAEKTAAIKRLKKALDVDSQKKFIRSEIKKGDSKKIHATCFA